MKGEIITVEQGSPAQRAGIRAGDILLDIDGHEIHDVLDLMYYQANRTLRVSIRRGGRTLSKTVRKKQYEDTGMVFASYLMDGKRTCANKCIFCFIDQLPDDKPVRDTLRFKDDDTRLSLIMGNYVTLTNLSDDEFERIKRLHISPLRISVHATDPEVRVAMMKNPRSGRILTQLSELAQSGIEMYTQIVLVKNVNDGEILKKTLTDLYALYPHVRSVAVVPSGLTRYREHLPKLEMFTPAQAGAVIDQIEAYGDAFVKACGARFVFASDEFYVKAGRRPHDDVDYYEDLSQLENGVGMVASFLDEVRSALSLTPAYPLTRKLTLVTGEAAYPFICEAFELVRAKFPGLDGQVFAVKNNYFGGYIDVAGLVTATDIIKTLQGQDLGEAVLFPCCMLRSEGDLFLDNKHVDELSGALGVKARPIGVTGGEFVDALLQKEA